MTKEEKRRMYFEAWQNSYNFNLSDVYHSYSKAKENAFNAICERAYNEGEMCVVIISHNCNFFTTAYVIERNGKLELVIDTAYNTYRFDVTDL